MSRAEPWRLSELEVAALLEARHGDPFAVLGPHLVEEGLVVRALLPGAEAVELLDPVGRLLGPLDRRHADGFFEGLLPGRTAALPYRLRVRRGAETVELDDPYRFGPVLGELDEHLLREGTHLRLWERLGAHPIVHEGTAGVHFAVWAPNASRVAVVGDFNGWDGRVHAMRRRLVSGVWEIFLPGVREGVRYKYEIKDREGRLLPLKADPFGTAMELRPATASIVRALRPFPWTDGEWMARRAEQRATERPISIYEVHLGSWRRRPDGSFLSWDELAEALLPYVAGLGFTHVELLPVSEHPLDASWGYQPLGLFAPTARFGDPEGLARFVDAAHRAGLGVILDWVPGHFPADPHGLGRFDGTALFEHEDPRQGLHPDWGTLVYNYGRTEVANYLLANALYWLEVYHVDGLRVDAVASMLYLDYSRKEGEWVPNRHGGNENLEAIAFLRRLNELLYAEHPGIVTIAEESTAWPGVSRPTWLGGLGFGFKWNMGWMHDTLRYFGRDPVHRRWHHHELTFGLLYAFSENFVLPLSHDEVVHGKGSLLAKMPGDCWQKFANLRALLGFMWGHPGKKLLFMGQEFAQGAEWNESRGLDWHLLEIGWHRGVQRLVADLNRLYRELPALHVGDCSVDGFAWVEANDADHSVYAWLRLGRPGDAPVLVVANLTPVPREGWRIGVPRPGVWRERLNTDAVVYEGSGVGNLGAVVAEPVPWHGRPFSVQLTLPPLAVLFFEAEDDR
ncbi:MAG: 1,4-alpha-glucan branching enzyme GlgB [Geminicoccaceae bacterium]|nr:MAG: 1,4-alpha-glucan branching enzyme GlgB [Geminicoccaceae bacterium]